MSIIYTSTTQPLPVADSRYPHNQGNGHTGRGQTAFMSGLGVLMAAIAVKTPVCPTT